MHYTALASGMLSTWRFLEARGVDPRPIFLEAGLDPAALADSNARYPVDGIHRLAEAVEAATGDELFGLRLGEHWHPSMGHALGYAWLASATLRDAFERLSRYYRITTDRDMVVLDDLGECLELALHNPDPNSPLPYPQIDGFFATIVHLCRQAIGDDFVPVQLQVQRPPPSDPQAYEEYFGTHVRFAANRSAMLVASEDADRCLPTANAEVGRANERILVDYLARHPTANTSLLVRERLTEQLPSGHATVSLIASALQVSERTLQRQLREEGTTFRELLDETRRELALEYLRDSSLSIKEITYLLGFSDAANFTRAFRRWAGVTPSGYREATSP